MFDEMNIATSDEPRLATGSACLDEFDAYMGDIVKITEGPLAGRLARRAGTAGQRVLIVVELEDRQVDIETHLDWIEAATPERTSASGAPEGSTWRNT
jgi:hypothetical protein